MSIKKRSSAPRTRLARHKPSLDQSLERMQRLIAAGAGSAYQAEQFLRAYYSRQLAKLQSIAQRAQEGLSWTFMEGSYKQAAELFVLSSVLYENSPDDVLMDDGTFDLLAVFLLRNIDRMDKDFLEWYAITAIDLKAGTGHRVTAQTPIYWMYAIRTGKVLPYAADTQVRPAELRGDAERGIVTPKSVVRKRPRKRLRGVE